MTLAVNNLSGFGVSNSVDGPIGHKIYDTPGSHSWIVPDGVTSVCVVCVGAGGSAHGSGGGLGWKNNIPVIPGDFILVIVPRPTVRDESGAIAYFKSRTLVRGGGGGGYNGVGGDFTGDGGGAGGTAGNFNTVGGAGGYLGVVKPTGPGGRVSGNSRYGGGSGVALYGEQNSTVTQAHNGNGDGGNYGGGNGYTSEGRHRTSRTGGKGAVRIIWGEGRSFPYNAQRLPEDL